MLKAFRASSSNIFVWAIILLLIVGLAGFGIGSGALTSRTVAKVGDQEISAEDYARALDQELRAINAQIGRSLTMSEARQFGVDRVVLARLVNDAALDGEAARLGLSVGDAVVGEQIRATSAFQGIDGSFDREAYRFALDRAGLSVREFEDAVRRETVREIIAASVEAPVTLPDTAALTILGFLGEQRSFGWLRLGREQLEEDVPEPGEDALQAFYAAAPERYTQPETREITYAALTPEGLAQRLEFTEEELAEAYEARRSTFETPERRIVDRIVFRTAEDAAAARARIDAGEIEFPGLAAERDLSDEEIDQGFVTAEGLPAEAREAVFGAEGPGVVGPVTTPLGPALYRINGILPAVNVPFEEAREALRRDLARGRAEERIRSDMFAIEDLLAGGATAEELAEEMGMELGTIALNAETEGGLADDPAFRTLAEGAREGVETDLAELGSGGIVTLRVDRVVPPTLLPFEDVRERVVADWTAEAVSERLSALAEGLTAEVAEGTELSELAERLETPLRSQPPLTRGEMAGDLPPELVAEIFEVAEGETVILPEAGGVILARLDAVTPFDPAAEENAQLIAGLKEQLRQQAAADVVSLMTQALQAEAGVSVNESLIESTLSRFP